MVDVEYSKTWPVPTPIFPSSVHNLLSNLGFLDDFRKPADSVPSGVTISPDSEGFDDIDEYFSHEFENKASLADKNRQIELDEEGKPKSDADVFAHPVRVSMVPQGKITTCRA